MKRGLLLCLIVLTGCVERRMTIVSDPPGAMVSINNVEIGAAPVDVPSHLFIDYGDYDIKLVLDRYEPLLVKQAVPPPWYEYFPLEFFSENIVPWTIRDKRQLAYQLTPARIVPNEELLENANQYRNRGQAVGPTPESSP